MLPAVLTMALFAAPAVAHDGNEGQSAVAEGAFEAGGERIGATLARTVRIPARAVLREVASPVARVLARLDEAADLPVLDRSGSWVRVEAGGRTGWVDLAAEGDVAGEDGAAAGPTSGETNRDLSAASAAGDPANPRAAAGGPAGGGAGGLVAAAADPAEALLAAARTILGAAGQDLTWGRFVIVTDRFDHPLIPLGERIAAELPRLHARRYGLPADEAPEAGGDGALLPPRHGVVVLFARDADYRAVLASLPGDLAARDLAGHASGGVAALPLGDRTARQATGTLVHEITHLLNQRAFGPDLPPWLDEGLAGDLELVDVGAGGELVEARWAEGATGYRGRRGRTGPLVALDRLVGDAARGRLESLTDLVALDRRTLVASPRRAELYALAALWVRFLLDDPQHAAGFRRFLAALAVADTTPADGGSVLLADALASDLAALERPFRRWLNDLARRL